MTGTAAALRRAFDQTFAGAPTVGGEALENLVALQLGGQRCLLRLSELASIHAEPRIVPVPSSAPDFLGLAGLRGVLVPVYDLRLLLGLPASRPPTWLVLARADHPLALAFDAFEEHLRLPTREVPPLSTPVQGHVQGTLTVSGVVRPLIHLASIVEALARRSRRDAPPTEP